MSRKIRLMKELCMQKNSPSSDISFWSDDDDMKKFQAVIFPDDDSVYRGGTFKLEIEIPARYPFLPPKVRFLIPIYHPNIDAMGRICLDLLKIPPSGGWRPSINIVTVLTSVRLLMSNPNPDDPLLPEIAEVYKINPTLYEKNAREWTQQYAMNGNSSKDKKSLSETDKKSSSETDKKSSSETEKQVLQKWTNNKNSKYI